MYYVYILKSKKDSKWYTGSTNDLRKRFNEHNSGKVFSTKGRGPFELIYYEACLNESDARGREKYLKSGVGKKYLKNRMKRFLSVTGFTLLEVLVAMLILVITVAGIFSVFIFTKRSTNIPGSQFQAVNLARQQAEELRVAVQNYYYINNIGPLATGSYGPDPVNIGTLPGTRSYVVTNVDLDGDSIAESRRVTITVNWNEPTP